MNIKIASLDFDGTLRFNNLEKDCIDLLKSLPSNIISVINTGRGIALVKEKVKTYFPDDYELFMGAMRFFICNNGTDIYYHNGNDYVTLKEWSDHLQDQWNRSLLLERLTPLAEELMLDLYPEVYNFKLLYYFHRKSFEEAGEVIQKLQQAVSDQNIKIIHAQSSQTPPPGLLKFVCEIFPLKAGKGNALIFLKDYLENQGDTVEAIACFGDDRNDIQTIVDMPGQYEWWYGCLVGNSTDWIISRAKEAMPFVKGKIIIAPPEYPGPEGIKWIMQKLNWL
jgi:HAD superfamily hydrolase (TIGR01484 family)